MSAEFLPLYRLCGTSISSMAHSWKGRLYSVNRFQSAYARRTMILPFSSNRSSTSLSSNCLYCASLTPRAMFSKSMNIASFRSPFIHVVLRCAGRAGRPTPWTWAEFLQLPRVTVRSDIHCVTRWSKLGNVWEGVSARFIVEHVRPRPEATFVLQHADPDYTTNTALADLLADDVVLALKHNGKDLEPDHGGPMRLVLPRLYFWKSSKWLRAFEFLDVNPPGFWAQNGYHMHADPWTEER